MAVDALNRKNQVCDYHSSPYLWQAMLFHSDVNHQQLQRLIKNQSITLAGNNRLKVYGVLSCKSGKQMKRQNRVFFVSLKEALQNGYRPCGHCLRKEYQAWIYSTQNPS